MSSTPSPNAISAHIAIRPDWLGKRREAALEPDLPIVDPHHHLIDRPESGTYLLPDLLADIADGGHNVVATVFSNGCRCTAPTGRTRCGRWARPSSSTASRR